MSVSIISFRGGQLSSYCFGNIYNDDQVLTTLEMGYNPAADCPFPMVEFAQQKLKPSVFEIANAYAQSLEGILGMGLSLEKYIEGEHLNLSKGITYVTYSTKDEFGIAHKLLEKYNVDAIIIKEQNLMALSCEYTDDIICRIVYDDKYVDAHYCPYSYELLRSGFCSDLEANAPRYRVEKTYRIRNNEIVFFLLACATYLYCQKKRYTGVSYMSSRPWGLRGYGDFYPWYAINDNPLNYQPYSSRNSGADMNAHVKAHHRMQELTQKHSMSKQQKRSMAQHSQTSWLMDLTMASRRALRGIEDNTLDEMGRKWLEHQIKDGLCDVLFVYRDWAEGPLLSGDSIGIICWYKNGDKRYTTIDVDDEDKPFLTERPLSESEYSKPKLLDNSEQFYNVLVKMANTASYGPTSFWGDQYRSAASEVKKGNLLKAAELSQSGGGMGSWYDTPMATMPDMKDLNLQLGTEREHAVMYAVNNS